MVPLSSHLVFSVILHTGMLANEDTFSTRQTTSKVTNNDVWTLSCVHCFTLSWLSFLTDYPRSIYRSMQGTPYCIRNFLNAVASSIVKAFCIMRFWAQCEYYSTFQNVSEHEMYSGWPWFTSWDLTTDDCAHHPCDLSIPCLSSQKFTQ